MNNYIEQLSIDCVVFGYQSKSLKVIITKIISLENYYALPGGFILQNEDIDIAARRILKERTSVDHIYLDQFKTFGKNERSDQIFIQKVRDNQLWNKNQAGIKFDFNWLSKRFVTIGYYALVDIEKVVLQKSEIDESVEWIDIDKVPQLIFDHNQIISEALIELREKFDKKLIGFNLLPPVFTMKDLQELYEVVYDMPFARNNFQKKILDLNVLERLEKKYTGAANKAPYLYRFKSNSTL